MRRPFAEVFYLVGPPYRGNRHEQMKRNLCNQVDQYAHGFREAEYSGNGLAIGYELKEILAYEGGALRIT